jgi:hypothetical protein
VDIGARIRADAANAVRGSVGSELWREQVEDGNHETITVSGHLGAGEWLTAAIPCDVDGPAAIA